MGRWRQKQFPDYTYNLMSYMHTDLWLKSINQQIGKCDIVGSSLSWEAGDVGSSPTIDDIDLPLVLGKSLPIFDH